MIRYGPSRKRIYVKPHYNRRHGPRSLSQQRWHNDEDQGDVHADAGEGGECRDYRRVGAILSEDDGDDDDNSQRRECEEPYAGVRARA